MSLASAFVKATCFQNLRFNTNLAYAEDAQLIMNILLSKQTVGVISEARYFYRQRSSGTASAVQSSGKTFSWYHPYLEHFTEHTIRLYNDRLGYVPLFVQNTLMYDLQWRFRQAHIPAGVMSDAETEAYRSRLIALLPNFDISVVLAQKRLSIEQKMFILQTMHPDAVPTAIYHAADNKWMLTFQNTVLYDFARFQFRYNFLRLYADHVEIEGSLMIPYSNFQMPRIYIVANGQQYEVTETQYDETIYSVDIPIAVRKGFTVRIPLQEDNTSFSARLDYGDFAEEPSNIILSKYFPITYKLSKSYYHKDGYTLFPTRKGFRITKQCKKQVIRNELALLKELMSKGQGRQIKIALSRTLVHLLRPLVHKNIWLITDKSDRADDNGEAFFLYCMKNKDLANCRPVFAIGKHSPDYKRMKQYGPVVPYMSLAHKLCHLLAAHTISAYSHDEISSPFYDYGFYYTDLMQRNKIVFL